ncbi:MAG: polysaccharide deacetylase family protein [Betaproteobacteria bacterium]
MFRLLGNALSPAGNRARLAVLMFHRVTAAPDPILPDVMDAFTFERHMAFIKREFNVLPLGEACARHAKRSLPARAACITFDDGYADNEQIALPILKRVGVPATFFVATGFLDGSTMFNDGVIEVVRTAPDGVHDLGALGLPAYALGDTASRLAAIDSLIKLLKYRVADERGMLVARLADAMGGVSPKNLMMHPAQVRRLRDQGMEIGGHTVNHPILMGLDEQEARTEIVDGKHLLEEITGAQVTLFAYPNGKPGKDYGPQHVRLVREAGFSAAVSTVSSVADRASDVFQLPRLSPWERNPHRLGLRLLMNCVRTLPA